MQRTSIRVSTAVAAGALVLVLGGPAASAAPGTPNVNSSCLAKIFQAQAVDAPQTVSNRIKEIREFFLEGGQFGQALQPLAHNKACPSFE